MRLSALDKLGHIFSDVMTEIVSTTAGLSLTIASSEEDGHFDEMIGAMQLSGKNSGTLFISANEPDLRVFCSAMVGVPESGVSKDDIDDALCELVNMVAGNAKLRLGNTAYSFNLTTPFLMQGANIALTTKQRIPILARTLTCDKFSLKLKVIFSQYP